jgi:diguanylate cyclase (GGDEF)-like protein
MIDARPDGPWRLTSDSAITIAAGMIILLGVTVMLGWHLGVARVVQLHPGFTPMQYNTALCFTLSGLAAMYARSHHRVAGAISMVVIAIGALSLLEYVLDRAFGIDELLMRAYINADTSDAGRMAPQTAIGFVFAGCALGALTLSRGSPYAKVVAQMLASLLGGVGLAAVVGYCVGLETAYGWAEFQRIAPHTAWGFVVLSLAILQNAWRMHAADPRRGPLLLATPVAVAALAVTASLFQALLAWQVERIDEVTTRNLERATALLETQLRDSVESFGALADRWGRGGGEVEARWTADAGRFLRDQQAFLAVSRVGADAKLDWIFPAAPYPDHIGYDYSANEARASWVALARERHRALLTEPVALKSGRPGILIVAPLLPAAGEGAPFVVTAALIEQLFRPTAAAMSAYRLAVFDGDKLIYGSETENGGRAIRSREIRIDGASLRLEATPLPETIETIRSPLPTVVLVTGVFASLLLALTAHFARVSSLRAAELSTANARLAAAKEKLERLALFDELTGLGNRNLLLMELDKRLAVSEREGLPLPLLLIDLNGFKAVNDTFGHEAGDGVLREVAARLVDSLPLACEAFRTGGDEFAVVTKPGTLPDEALVIAREVERVTQAPLLVDGEHRVITASVGIATYPRHGGDRTRLLRAADVAMYQAKHAASGVQVASDEAPTSVLRALHQPESSA